MVQDHLDHTLPSTHAGEPPLSSLMPGWLQGEALAQEKAPACPEEEPCLSGVEGTSEGRLHQAALGERTAQEELGQRPVGRAGPSQPPVLHQHKDKLR